VLLLFLIPLVFGLLLAQRVLAEPRRLVQVYLGISLGTAFTLLPLNALLSFSQWGMTRSLSITMLGQVLGCLALCWIPGQNKQFVGRARWDQAQTWALLPTLLIYFSSLAYRLMSTDDDFFVHAPVQGMLSRGNFPPYNPFFIEIPMHGHYGRDLLLGGLSTLLGCSVLGVETLSTAVWQATAYGLFWASLNHRPSPRWSDHLAPLLIFFGVNCGLNSGLNFLPLNNNPIAYMYVATCLWFFLRHRQSPEPLVGILWGLSLGGMAIVYETHFGLCVLATACASLLLRPSPKFFGQLMLPAVLAAVLALTQGGPLTQLAHRPQHEAQLSQGMQNMSQTVKMKVPKPELWQIKLYSDNNPQARLSLFYQHFGPSAWKKLHPNPGYTPIWSWEFLKLHFLPVYLAPISGWVLWRRRHAAGLWLWFFGLWAFLVPALVNFGPVYESEYMRWEFASAMAWAACLGLTCCELPGRRFWQLAVGLCFLPAIPTGLAQMQALSTWPGPKSWLLLLPTGLQWLELQGDPDFRRADFEAAMALRKASSPRDRVLVDSDLENHKTLVYESTLTALSGVRCVGHSFPLDEEEIGLPPYRHSPAAAGFWRNYNLEALRQLKVQWVLRRVPPGTPPLSGLPAPRIFSDAVQERQLYDARGLSQDGWNYALQTPKKSQITVTGATSVRPGRVYPARLEQPNGSVTGPQRWALVSPHDQKLDPRDWLWNSPSLGEHKEIWWMAPTAEEPQQMQLYAQDERGIYALEGARLLVRGDYRERVAQLKPEFQYRREALPNQIIPVDVQLDLGLPGLDQEPDNRWLVALEFLPTGKQERVDVTQGPRARLQRLSPPSEGKMRVWGQVPGKPGPYQINLVVNPEGDKNLRWPVGSIEVYP